MAQQISRMYLLGDIFTSFHLHAQTRCLITLNKQKKAQRDQVSPHQLTITLGNERK